MNLPEEIARPTVDLWELRAWPRYPVCPRRPLEFEGPERQRVRTWISDESIGGACIIVEPEDAARADWMQPGERVAAIVNGALRYATVRHRRADEAGLVMGIEWVA